MSYKRDRTYAERYIPEMQRILGELPARLFGTVRAAPLHLDMKQATDLIWTNIGGKNIGARIRRPEYFQAHYRTQFTIRSHRDSGAETELSKIERGFGDWIFYGFGDE